MRISVFLGILLSCFAALSVSALGQKTKRPVPRPTPTPARTFVSADERVAKQTASNQLSNVSVYLNKFTPLVQTMNDLAKDDKAHKLSKRASTDFNNAKRNLLIQLSDFKLGLTTLETDFKTKPALTKYLLKIQGITDLSVSAQDSANLGRFDGVRESLKGIVQRLSDTVAAMPS
ncbi:MAG: hypothetical protein ABI878_11895 [Acidobacteriota bacterium]